MPTSAQDTIDAIRIIIADEISVEYIILDATILAYLNAALLECFPWLYLEEECTFTLSTTSNANDLSKKSPTIEHILEILIGDSTSGYVPYKGWSKFTKKTKILYLDPDRNTSRRWDKIPEESGANVTVRVLYKAKFPQMKDVNADVPLLEEEIPILVDYALYKVFQRWYNQVIQNKIVLGVPADALWKLSRVYEGDFRKKREDRKHIVTGRSSDRYKPMGMSRRRGYLI